MKLDDAGAQPGAAESALASEIASPAPVGVPKGRSWIFAAALSTIFMAAIEGTIVATAMPTIVGALGGFELFSWVFSAYLLTQAVTIPIYGRLADVYGRKRVLLVGIGLFLIGSVLSGFAWSMISLIAFRVIQATGAGALIPVAQTIVGDIYRGEQRARMQGYVSSTFGSAAVIGPAIGSFLVAHVTWSMVFWVNVPLGIAAAVMLQLTLDEEVRKRPHRIDYLGAALMIAGTTSLMFALVQAAGLPRHTIIGLILASGVSFAALWIHESRTPEPMLPLKLFRNRIVASGNVVGLANGAIMMGIVAFLPAYMQGVMGSTALLAGVALTAMSVAWPIGGLAGSRIMLWFSYRVAATIGSVVLLIGSVLMIALDPAFGAAWPIAGALLVGLGLGVTNICFVVAVQANVEWAQRGIATSSTVFSRIVGQSLGTAVFAGMINVGLSGHAAAGSDIVVRLQRGLHQAVERTDLDAAMGAFTHSLHNVYLINGLLAVVVLIAIQFLPAGLKLVQETGGR